STDDTEGGLKVNCPARLSCRSGTVTQHGKTEVAAVHLGYDARIAEGVEARADVAFGDAVAEFSSQAGGGLDRIAFEVERGVQAGEEMSCLDGAIARVGDEHDRASAEQVEARPVRAGPFWPAVDFMRQGARVFSGIRAALGIELKEIGEI